MNPSGSCNAILPTVYCKAQDRGGISFAINLLEEEIKVMKQRISDFRFPKDVLCSTNRLLA